MANTFILSAPTHRSAWYGLMILAAITGALALLPELALASSNAPVESILCQLVTLLQGTTGKALATVAFGALGLMALFGKLDKGAVAVIAVGMAMMFGAVNLVPAMGGSSAGCGAAPPQVAFSCTNGVPTSNLFMVADNTTYTNLNTATGYNNTTSTTTTTGDGTCDAIQSIFAHVLCTFKSTVGEIMSTMYCSFQAALLKPLSIALTLFVAIFGVLIVTGIVDLTVKEAAVALFKIALVWAFAMNSDWGIGIAYRFFMGAAEEGSNIVLHALDPTGTVALGQLDTTLTNVFSYTSGGAAPAAVGGATTGIASLSPYCAKFLAYAAAFMVFFLPIGTAFVGGVVLQYAMLYMKAILGYLTVLVLISFLFIVSPLFISFALFKTTYKLFEKWVQYLTTFSLQMILVFALLAMCQLILGPFSAFLNETLGLVREYDGTWSKAMTTEPFHVCSICKYTPNPITDFSLATTETSSNNITCTTGYDANDQQYVKGFDKNGQTLSVIPLVHLLSHNDLLIFIVSNVVALWLIASVLSEFLKKAPELARQLGGLPFAPSILGGSSATPDIPSIKTPGVDALGNRLQSTKDSLIQNPVTRSLFALGAGLGAGALFSKAQAQGTASATSTQTPSRAPATSTASTQASQGAQPVVAMANQSNEPTVGDLRVLANNTMLSVQNSIASSAMAAHLKESDIQQIKTSVDSLKGQLQSAQTVQSYNNIISQLQTIQRKIRG